MARSVAHLTHLICGGRDFDCGRLRFLEEMHEGLEMFSIKVEQREGADGNSMTNTDDNNQKIRKGK